MEVISDEKLEQLRVNVFTAMEEYNMARYKKDVFKSFETFSDMMGKDESNKEEITKELLRLFNTFKITYEDISLDPFPYMVCSSKTLDLKSDTMHITYERHSSEAGKYSDVHVETIVINYEDIYVNDTYNNKKHYEPSVKKMKEIYKTVETTLTFEQWIFWLGTVVNSDIIIFMLDGSEDEDSV